MNNALEITGLSKRYQLGQSASPDNIREVIAGWFRRPRNREKNQRKTLWALRDVSFSVAEGEVLGVVGRNGAGKSTLLKLLSGITHPTAGEIRVRGRVASLLEVGTGFHDELTGRENIYLNGSILGMPKREIDAKLDQIVDFAGVHDFIDTPIKRYSSGMKLRLGFAVAAHLDPDILLVDEVLAVGDAEFQKKCLNAMDDLRSGGRTVLFVAHNMAAIENLCSRTMWIDAGRIRMDGPTHDVVQAYMASFATTQQGSADLEAIESRHGNGDGRFTRIEFLDMDGRPLPVIRSGDRLRIRLHYRAYKRLRDLVVGINIHTDLGALLTASNNWATGDDIPYVEPGDRYVDWVVDLLNLQPGRYYLSLWLGRWDNPHDVLKNCVAIDIESADYYGSGRGIDSRFGLIFMPCRWEAGGRQ
ncbi:MAG TPA: ABC transporter ATP-binding protein [Longimicrobiales bacterium]